MKLQDIKNLDKDELLRLLGFESKSSFSNRLLGTMGIFGGGLLVGAGVALLARRAGRELCHGGDARQRCDCKGTATKDDETSGVSQTAHHEA